VDIKMAPYRKRRRVAGAMLLDALIALFVAVTVMTASTSLTVSALAAAESSRKQSVAVNAARQVFENLRSYKGAKIENGTYADATVFGSVPQLSQMAQGTASVVISTYRTTVKQAKVTIRWRTGSRRRQREMSVTTLITGQGVTP
jgi:Tfp pilus assembly protein PilV